MKANLTALALVVLIAACRDWDRYAPGGAGGAGAGGAGGASDGAGGSGGAHQPTGGAGGSQPANWFDNGLSTRRPVDIVRAASGEPVTDFPILVRLDRGQAVEGELRLVADDHRTLLAHEIERLDPDGESLVWVRVPSVGATATRIWLYAGGVAESAALPPTDTWSNGFTAVWHLETSAADSTLGAHTGVTTDASLAAGFIGNGFIFDGDGDHVDVAASVDFDTLFIRGGTLSAYVQPTSGGELGRGRILDRSTASAFTGGWALLSSDFAQTESVGFAYAFTDAFAWWTTPPGSVQHGTWHHVAASFVEGDAAPILHVDGVEQTVLVDSAGAGPPSTVAGVDLRIGGRTGGVDRDYDGSIDELRVAAAVRSSTWVATEAENMAGGLVTVGAVER